MSEIKVVIQDGGKTCKPLNKFGKNCPSPLMMRRLFDKWIDEQSNLPIYKIDKSWDLPGMLRRAVVIHEENVSILS